LFRIGEGGAGLIWYKSAPPQKVGEFIPHIPKGGQNA
jgi:hypothetical protein